MEENMVKFEEKLKELVALGKKKKNILELQEINDLFADMELSPEHMEKVFEYLDAKNIDVLRITSDNIDDDIDDESILKEIDNAIMYKNNISEMLAVMPVGDEKANLEILTTMSNIAGEIVPVSIDFDLVDIENKTLGEKMLNALFNSIIGLCSVFVVLSLISFIIYLFKFIPKFKEIFTKKDKGSVSVALENAIAQIEGNEELIDDMELVAVITAAICASTGASSDSFVVRSIKKADRKKKHI